MSQKVITVNINVYESDQDANLRNYAHELTAVNEFLDQGWYIQNTIHSVPTGNPTWINITFILALD